MSASREYIAVAVAPVRREPSHESECLTQALHGEAFETVETTADGAWARVRLDADGYEGWLRSWYGAAVPGEGPGLRLRARSAEIRASAKGVSEVLTSLPWQARLWELERADTWTIVRLADGRMGFVPTRLVEGADPPGGPATPSRLWRTACRLTGAPYLWGGRTAWGYDCSGLVQAVLAWHGVAAPRDARDQLARARRVRSAKRGEAPFQVRAAKGDLLYFGPSPGTANHVALSGGNGEFLHAYGQVCLGSLNPSSQHYVPSLVSTFIGVVHWRSFAPPEPRALQ